MRLTLPEPPPRYKSPSQRSRVSTEAWAANNLFCPNCTSPELTSSRAGMPAIDYTCPRCDALFQLKSQRKPFVTRIIDAAYSAMRAAILADRTPNLLALHYDPDEWRVCNLVLIPHFAFTLAALERRNPLSAKAERAGWVGCNILLTHIPLDARIPMIVHGQVVPSADVRRRYKRLRPLAEKSVEKRGWTLDVLNVVREIGRDEFTLADVYRYERDLARLHPGNRHIRDKIRQQLQVLRKMGLVRFLDKRGRYRVL